MAGMQVEEAVGWIFQRGIMGGDRFGGRKDFWGEGGDGVRKS